MADLSYLTIRRAHQLLASKEVSAVELVNFHLDQIKKIDTSVRAVLTACSESALEAAKEVDAKITQGKSISLLEGIPYTAKDMFLTKGGRTTAASKILNDFIAPYSATVIDKLEQAGAIMIAKVNQDEFAHGSSTENSAYQPTHNPWNVEYVPGGSSGGSTAAVAADIGIFSIGTDTGGSIRQPASYCGVVGLKPTYGLVSRYGVVAMASSLDVIGPITRNVEDAAIVLEVIAGQDKMDSTTIKADNYDFSLTTKKTDKFKIGIVKEYVENLDDANRQALDDAARELEGFGHSLEVVSLPNINAALPCYYVLTPSEISSNLERYDGIRYGSSSPDAKNLLETYNKTRGQFFGSEVKRRILTGTYALSAGYYEAYYKKAMKVRTLIKEDFDKSFSDYDVLIGPTTPTPAFSFGSIAHPTEMYLSDIMTVAANLAGIPAISLPSGFIDGRPVGLQIMTAQGDEAKLFTTAGSFEARTTWHERRAAV